jgi:hypothetical protein
LIKVFNKRRGDRLTLVQLDQFFLAELNGLVQLLLLLNPEDKTIGQLLRNVLLLGKLQILL